ncbi:hypothetical protein TraAM80_03931 [Trypanosoma rangeli]|uniref:Uncharacterized protein n=1 Tax=Trypanosoma rangeli TaxID=5698 RepID=A0A3R7MPY3_TRYRA|nr:uncharacterized protein TraAM80_03931 [Trypanosoma rangeli]RNF06358.1 hypothetical protein TraAM80_03931 [Trypanosoma rangeli]|eukprot:RNF06358.1 hypothetical protein TraAM80_03931 [Trypanosoma rangeli]
MYMLQSFGRDMETSSDKKENNSRIHHSLQRGLCAVTDEKTILSLRLDELQREVERLRGEKAGCNHGNVVGDAELAECQCRVMERANEMLHVQMLRDVTGNQSLCRQSERKPHTSSLAPPGVAAGIDGVQLPLEGLRRAVRDAFGPGRHLLDDGTAVTVEYTHDHVVVRGSRASRNAFMAFLLHIVLRYMGGTPQREWGDSAEECPSLSGPRAVSRPTATVGVSGENEGGRALESVQMERERSQMARQRAEHEPVQQQATSNFQRAQNTEQKRQLGGRRVEQLEVELRRKWGGPHVVLHRHVENDVAPRRKVDDDYRADAMAETSPQRGRDPVHSLDRSGYSEKRGVMSSASWAKSNLPAMAPDAERSLTLATEGSGIPANRRVGGSPLRSHACEETLLLLQREVELLRDEKHRLLRQLQCSADDVKQQRRRLQDAEAATAHLCRSVLNSSEVVATVLRGEAAAPYLMLHRGGGVDEHRVQALVQALSENSGTAHDDGDDAAGGTARLMEQRLVDVAALLEIERRTWKAALAFAVDERDAAMQAQQEEALLARPDTATVAPPLLTTATTALEKENVELRIELQRCFEDMRRLAHVIARSHTMYQEAQEKLRAGDRRMHEKEETVLSVRRRQDSALMAALERERALELQLQRLQQQGKWDATHSLRAAAVAHTEPQREALAHLVSTPSKGSCAVSGTTFGGSRNNQPHQPQVKTDTQECSFVSRGNGLQSGPSTATTPLWKTEAAGTAVLSSPSTRLQKGNFERALRAIHPS